MKKKRQLIHDCRECPNFHWDFVEGRFFCERAKDKQVEDLHLIPDWCPISESIWTTAFAGCEDARCY